MTIAPIFYFIIQSLLIIVKFIAAKAFNSLDSPLDSRMSATSSGSGIPGPSGTASAPATGKGGFLKKRPVIGVAGTPLGFARDDRAFHALDTPAPAAKARHEVAEAMRLSRSGATWNTSTATSEKPCDRRAMTNFAFDPATQKFSFRAEVLPSSLPVERDVFGRITGFASKSPRLARTQEMPTHPSLASKGEWDVRTREGASEVSRTRDLAAMTAASLEATTRKRDALLARSGSYVDPVSAEKRFMATLRAEREEAAAERVAAELAALEASGVQPHGAGGFHNTFCLKESAALKERAARARSTGAAAARGATGGISRGRRAAEAAAAASATGSWSPLDMSPQPSPPGSRGGSRSPSRSGQRRGSAAGYASGGGASGAVRSAAAIAGAAAAAGSLARPLRSLSGSALARSRVYRKYKHTGTFGAIPAALSATLAGDAASAGGSDAMPGSTAGGADAEGAAESEGARPAHRLKGTAGAAAFAWSCCGSEDPESRGCAFVTVNPDRRIFEGL